jgi:hypothetical protein
MQDITKSIEKGENTSKPTKYTMTAKNYQDTSQVETIDGEIETVTPEDQEHKTQAQLILTVCGFMIDKIERLPKKTDKKTLN